MRHPCEDTADDFAAIAPLEALEALREFADRIKRRHIHFEQPARDRITHPSGHLRGSGRQKRLQKNRDLIDGRRDIGAGPHHRAVASQLHVVGRWWAGDPLRGIALFHLRRAV